jgi:uncharacterized protein
MPPARFADAHVAGTPVVCDASGVAFLEGSRTLIVSDLHLEKGAAFARRGYFLPPYDTAATLSKLATVIAYYRPASVVSLGDSFHDRIGAAHMPDAYRDALQVLMAGRQWIWITGNHDPDRPAGLAGEWCDSVCLDGLTLRHEPSIRRDDAHGEIAGHLHPAARVVRRGKGIRRACFAVDGHRLVMPAFGVTTGGLDLSHRAMTGLFERRQLVAHLVGTDRIYSVRYDNLVG